MRGIEQCLIRVGDFFDVSPTVREYRKVVDPQERQQILAWYERPGWKGFMYRIAGRLRQEWELSPGSDTQAAITKGFIDTNTSNWERSVRWKHLILKFLNSGDAKDSLTEVAKNLHRQWDQGQPVVQELIGGPTPKEKIAWQMDPYFESSKAFKKGEEMCRDQGVSVDEVVYRGIILGFTNRNMFNLIKETDEKRRGEIFQWLNDNTRTERALQAIASHLSHSALV